MSKRGKKFPFPGIKKLSFYRLFEELEKQQNDPDPHVAAHAKALLKEMEPFTDLKEGFEDMRLLKKYGPQIERLMRFIFPDVLGASEIKAAVVPYLFEPICATASFHEIMNNAGDDNALLFSHIGPDQLYQMGCLTILEAYYKYPIKIDIPMHFEIPNIHTGTKRYYKMSFNPEMIDIIPTEKAIDITESDFHELVDRLHDLAFWKEKFPENSWILRGIGMMTLIDATADHAISELTANLLNKDNRSTEQILENLKLMLNAQDLELGFTSIEGGMFTNDNASAANSIILNGKPAGRCDELLCTQGFQHLIDGHQPWVVSNVELYNKNFGSQLAKNLKKQGFGSYLIVPIEHEGEYLGFLELASKQPFVLNQAAMVILRPVIPILAMAAARFMEEAQNRIEAIIQQECTTIHSSVKWRFEKEAQKYMIAEKEGGQPQFQQLGFKEVYPLYGQLDIKGSSSTRNEAVKNDLLKQMTAVKSLLNFGLKVNKLPALKELIFRVDSYLREIKDGLMAGSEHKILNFLRREIYPIFGHLAKINKEMAARIEEYNNMLNDQVNMVYEARKNFDESVTMINNRLAGYLDAKQEEAQAMFPHYFERYKTDGVEYNMYIGESIVNELTYHPLYLSNLRLWQLLVMCEMEFEFFKLQEELYTPLEVASLILVYGNSLAIHFRMDEKRFDVEGAYNARYEIVKKRVDKAHIKGTKERVTVPKKIAIIYSSEQDVLEYRKYIQFLQSIGYLKDTLEELQLEDLQGITGLKALRVELDYSQATKDQVTYSEIMEAMNPEATEA